MTNRARKYSSRPKRPLRKILISHSLFPCLRLDTKSAFHSDTHAIPSLFAARLRCWIFFYSRCIIRDNVECADCDMSKLAWRAK